MKYFLILIIALSLIYGCNDNGTNNNGSTVKLWIVGVYQSDYGAHFNVDDTISFNRNSSYKDTLTNIDKCLCEVFDYASTYDNYIVVTLGVTNTNDRQARKIIISDGTFSFSTGGSSGYAIGSLKEIK
jgi:hypothetical protein